VHIGNFVEVKNSTLAAGAKANHLAYLGDATVGERVNYGAGSITANYDGANKHRTVIEADVHVGSNCVLVAPVTIGAGGTVGGGSTITKSTPAGASAWRAASRSALPTGLDPSSNRADPPTFGTCLALRPASVLRCRFCCTQFFGSWRPFWRARVLYVKRDTFGC
jgi:bifunctional UDP-N-acetylglucosamine pyrophosphorylase/glucosamine-1-phosphate N-acetyltransferase